MNSGAAHGEHGRSCRGQQYGGRAVVERARADDCIRRCDRANGSGRGPGSSYAGESSISLANGFGERRRHAK
jgi:hypothetical protein